MTDFLDTATIPLLADSGIQLLDGGNDNFGVTVQAFHQFVRIVRTVHRSRLECFIFRLRLRVKVMAVNYKHHLIHIIQFRNQLCSLKGSQRLAGTGRVPDIAVIVRVDHTVQNLLDRIELVGTKHHQAFIPLMQHNVLADDFSQGTLVKENSGKLFQVIERHIGSIRPIEGKLIAAVRIVGKIAGIHSIGYDEKLDVVEQPMERSLVVALNLVVCLFEFYSSAFQFDLNQGKAIDEYRYIIAALFPTLYGYLVGDLKFVLAPMGTVQKFYPHPFTAFQFKRIQVA